MLRFQSMWTGRKNFIEVVHQSWIEPVQGFGMFAFMQKLKRLKFTLKACNTDHSGNVFQNAKHAEYEVREQGMHGL